MLYEISFSYIKERIDKLYKTNTNGLTLIISDILTHYDQKVFNIYNLVNELNVYFNHKYDKTYNLLEFADIISVIYLSNKTLYNLPMLLNNDYINNKPSTHLIFGEDTVLLAIISMGIDSISELTNFINKYYPEKRNIISKFIIKDYYVFNIFTEDKNDILINYNNDYKQLIEQIFYLFGIFYDLNENDLNNLLNYSKKVSQYLINNSTLSTNIFINELNLCFNTIR